MRSEGPRRDSSEGSRKYDDRASEAIELATIFRYDLNVELPPYRGMGDVS